MKRETAGTTAWVALGVGIAAYDWLGPETLSSAFRRGREHENPLVRAATIGGLAITALHLMEALPRSVDPFLIIDRTYHDIRGDMPPEQQT